MTAIINPNGYQIDKRFYSDKNFLSSEDFFKFIAWMVKTDEFVLNIEGHEFKIKCHCDAWAYIAVTDNYDGPGDNLNIAVHTTRAGAIEELAENLSEAIYEGRLCAD